VALISPRRALIAALLLGGAAAGAALLGTGERLESLVVEAPVVKKVEVIGNERASEVSLRHLADIREGQSLLSLNLDAVVASVSRHPWVRSVTVSRDITGTVRLSVSEHRAVMLLAHDGLYRVSDEGEVFVRARSDDLDLPILTGVDAELIEAHGYVAARIVDHALEILGALDGRAGLTPERLSELNFDRHLGFTLILREGSRIRLGFGEPAQRLDRLDAIVREGVDLSLPHEVDLDYPDLAIVTTRAS
jgi:cell division protein FtsQ